jgi:hypothetical protein
MSSLNLPTFPGAVNPNAKLYVDGIAEIRHRIGVARRPSSIAPRAWKNRARIMFLQMRKCCELIARLADRESQIAQQHAAFADWRVKDLIKRLRS